MKSDKWLVIFGISLVFVVLGCIVGFEVWKNKNHSQQKSKSTSSSSATNDSNDSLSVANQSGVALGSNSNGSLQSNIGQQSAADGPNAPSPNSFKEYEKYKDAKNSLFGDIKVGNGKEVAANSKVAILYKGYLTNGQLFDESKPEKAGGKIVSLNFEIAGGQVIPGIEQGVFGMKVGGKRRIIIPPTVGYGEKGYGPIPPNAVIVFDVELVDVQ